MEVDKEIVTQPDLDWRTPLPLKRAPPKETETRKPPTGKSTRRRREDGFVKVPSAGTTPKSNKRSSSDTKTKTVTRDDIEEGFDFARRGAAIFIDTTFKEDLAKLLETEYKCKIENWSKMLHLWQAYNTALAHLYLTKTTEILSLPPGAKLEVMMPKEEAKEKVEST